MIVTNGGAMQAGTLDGGQVNLSAGAPFTWSGGNIQTQLIVAANEQLSIVPSNVQKFVEGNETYVHINGTANWNLAQGNDSINLTNVSTFEIEPGGAFTISSNGNRTGTITIPIGAQNPGQLVVDRNATMSAQNTTVNLEVMFYDHGSATVANGEFDIRKGFYVDGSVNSPASTTTFYLDTSNQTLLIQATLSQGFMTFNIGTALSGTVALNGTTTIAANTNVTESDGVSFTTNSGGLLVQGSLSWLGGNWSGPGQVRVDPNGALTINAPGGVQMLNGWSLNNAGTVSWAAGNITIGGQFASSTPVQNSGAFNIQADGTLQFNAGEAVSFINSGTLTKSGGQANGRTEIAMAFSNSGTVQLTGGNLTIDFGYGQSAGLTALNTFTLAASFFTLSGGSLTGPGWLQGSVTNTGAAISIATASAGGIRITGDYSQSGSASLSLRIMGNDVTQYDVLTITGNMTLGGTLTVTLVGYVPQAGDTFDIISWQTVTNNDFNTVNLPVSLRRNNNVQRRYELVPR
jgi:hypothetical protein